MGRVLVTGGAGFIGSHTVLELVQAGFEAVVVDNLCNSVTEGLRRVGEITGKPERIHLHVVDICDEEALEKVFQAYDHFDAVIHFAGLKAVGDSVKQPSLYYRNNVLGTLTLFKLMGKYQCRRIIFSSSATVYGTAPAPYTEDSPVGTGITNPYGWTKFMIEQIFRDVHNSTASAKQWNFVLLRYFNPVGAHPCGRIGEDPRGAPNNLMPYIAQVAVGRRTSLTVFGGPGNQPFPTSDGTGERDYIHVVDLAKGHLAALRRVLGLTEGGTCDTYNLGSGQPVSVLQLIQCFEKACGKPLPYQIGAQRPGDLPSYWADVSKAERELGWRTTLTVQQMCEDTWRWQSTNPKGYGCSEERNNTS